MEYHLKTPNWQRRIETGDEGSSPHFANYFISNDIPD